MRVLDRVFAGGEVPDPRYRDRRESSFVVIAECGTPAGTCFCTSMGTGPGVGDGAEAGYDLALTELTSSGGPRYLVRIGSEQGAEVAEEMGGSPAGPKDLAARDAVLEEAARRIDRKLGRAPTSANCLRAIWGIPGGMTLPAAAWLVATAPWSAPHVSAVA